MPRHASSCSRAESRASTRIAALAALLTLSWVEPSAAQQVVLLDQVVNPRRGLPTTELNKSEYTVFAQDFANASPASLRSPVNYAEGNIHVRLEVLSKPSNLETLFTLCLHDASNITCIRYLPKYTAPGVYEYDQPMLGQYNYDVYDFGKPVSRVILAIKDGMERILDPSDPSYDSFFPTEYRITLALVAKGAKYVPPVATPRDAGTDAAASVPDASASAPDAGAPTTVDAGSAIVSGSSVQIVDSRLTATAQGATDSKIGFPLSTRAPASLKTPTDYAAGKLHTRVEVFSKPSGAPTYLKACLESMTGKTLCSDYVGAQTYLSESALDHEQTLASMQNAASYDWTSPLRRAYLVMSDASGASVAGKAEFFPTDLRLMLTLLPPGARYTPPWELSDAAVSAEGGSSVDPGGALRDDAGSGTSGGGPNGAASRDGAAPGGPDASQDDAWGTPETEPQGDDGCSLTSSRRTPHDRLEAAALVWLALLAQRRRRRRAARLEGVAGAA
jgi:MYXO-CTERM domain-containing protein